MKIHALTISEWADLATIIGIVLALVGLVFAAIQLRQIKQANYATGFLKAIELLQAENLRVERKRVYALESKESNLWTSEEKDSASKVCSNYDTVGAMVA